MACRRRRSSISPARASSAWWRATAEMRLLLASSGGTGLRCQLKDLVTRQRAGKAFMNVARAKVPGTRDDPRGHHRSRDVVCRRAAPRLPAAEVNELSGGGKGVILMRLHEGEALLGARAVTAP